MEDEGQERRARQVQLPATNQFGSRLLSGREQVQERRMGTWEGEEEGRKLCFNLRHRTLLRLPPEYRIA